MVRCRRRSGWVLSDMLRADCPMRLYLIEYLTYGQSSGVSRVLAVVLLLVMRVPESFLLPSGRGSAIEFDAQQACHRFGTTATLAADAFLFRSSRFERVNVDPCCSFSL